CLHGADLLNFWPAELHNQPILDPEKGFARWVDFDAIAVQDVTPRRPGNVQFAVTGALQVIGQIRHCEGFASVNPHGSGIDPGSRLLNMTGKTKIDHPPIGNPVISSYADGNKDEKNCSPKKNQAKPGAPIALANSNSQGSSPFRR